MGPHLENLGPRFPDSTDIYSQQLRTRAMSLASPPLKEGIYAGMMGPSYETPAEIRMMKLAGADMAGMSTIPEALAAAFLGMQVLGISCITNMASGITGASLGHAEVVAAGEKAAAGFTRLLVSILGIMGCHMQELS